MKNLKNKHQELKEKHENLWSSLFGDIVIDQEEQEKAREEKPKLFGELQKTKRDIKKFEQELLTYPELRDNIRFWMVDVVGCSNKTDNCEDIMETWKETNDMHYAVSKSDNVAGLVMNYLVDKGFNVTDSGGSCGGWHVGVHCTDDEANAMIRMVRDDFKEFLDEGVIKLEKKMWSVSWKYD